jgi:L-threonylcarbamoyladenylate synthase
MKVIKADKEKLNSSQIIDTVAESIRSGQVIVYPTDTVYGIGCLATDDKAVNRVYRTKKRSKNKPLLVLVGDLDMAKDFFEINGLQEKILKQYWPGPYSFLLKEKGKLSPTLSGNGRVIGVRLPKSDFVIRMVNRAGAPVVSTSLNVSGEKILTRLDNMEKIFTDDLPDLAVDFGKIENRTPSKLMDLTDPGNIKILRD